MTPKQMTIGLVLVLAAVVIAAGGGAALFAVAFPVVGGYLAYRIIRGGFTHSQSAKLNFFGWVGCCILVILAIWFAQWVLRMLGLL
jgi:multisubunit Na+/H+ antiporter MnhF subunit